MQWTKSQEDVLVAFANGHSVMPTGPHALALRKAIKRVLKRYSQWHGAPTINTADCCCGLTAVLAMTIKEPIFAGATRQRICNPEVEDLLFPVIDEWFSAYLECHPADANAIFQRVKEARDQRLASVKNPDDELLESE